MTTPADIKAAGDVLVDVASEADNMGFEEATIMRESLFELRKQLGDAISFVESAMLRQCERAPKVIQLDDGRVLTFINSPAKSTKTDHNKVLARLYRMALDESTNPETGNVDWVKLGETVTDLVIGTYLSPSTTAKRGGLNALGISRRDVETSTTTGRKLNIHEETDE